MLCLCPYTTFQEPAQHQTWQTEEVTTSNLQQELSIALDTPLSELWFKDKAIHGQEKLPHQTTQYLQSEPSVQLISIYTIRKVKYEKLRSPQYVASLQDLELRACFRLFREAWSNFLPKLIEQLRKTVKKKKKVGLGKNCKNKTKEG